MDYDHHREIVCAKDRKIDATRDSLEKKIDTSVVDIRADMKEMRAAIKELSTGIADLKGLQKVMLWILGSVTGVIAIVGGALAIARTLGWI